MKTYLLLVLFFCCGLTFAQDFEFLKNYEVGNKLVYDYDYSEFDQYAYQDSSIVLTSFKGEKIISIDDIISYENDSLVYLLSIEKNGIEKEKTGFKTISEKTINSSSNEKIVVNLNDDGVDVENHLFGWIFPDTLYQTEEALLNYPYDKLYNFYSKDDTSLTISRDTLEIEYLSKYVNYHDSYFSVKYKLTTENGLTAYLRKYDYYRSGFYEDMILKTVGDTESDLNFYPLDIGNYWEYEAMNGPNPYGFFEPLYSLLVNGDTTLANGNNYKILERKYFNSSSRSYSYERIDSLDGSVYCFDVKNNVEFKIDSLFANPGDTIAASSFGAPSTTGGIVCREIKSSNLFDEVFMVKEFEDNSTVPGKIYSLAKGLGKIYDWTYEGNFWIERLTYAKIQGKEYGEIVGVKNENNIPRDLALHQNYPNPFNPETLIEYDLSKSSNIKLKIFNLLGEEIVTLIDDFNSAGKYKISFNAAHLTSGVYFYSLITEEKVLTKKMILLR